MNTSTHHAHPARSLLRALLVAPLLAAAFSLAALAGSTAPAGAAGTGSVSGTVVTQAGVPVANAHVLLRELGRQAISGADGAYSIQSIPLGDYTIDFTAPCRESGSGSVTVGGAATAKLIVQNELNRDTFGHACRPTSFALLSEQQLLPLTGDDKSVHIILPFAFPFYGSTKTAADVSTNGYLTFGTNAVARDNTRLSDPGAPPDSIFPFWDDLEVDASASVVASSIGTAPGRVLMIEWHNVRFFGDASGSRITFQVQLFENGRIDMAWRDLDGSLKEQGNTATIGIRNAVAGAGGDFIEHSVDQASLVDGLKEEYVTNTAPIARAGTDQTVASGTSFTLDGSGSSDDGGSSNLTFRWLQIAGPASSIQDPKKSKTTVTGQVGPKTFTYRLTVTDQFGRSSSDDVTVTVKAPK